VDRLVLVRCSYESEHAHAVNAGNTTRAAALSARLATIDAVISARKTTIRLDYPGA